MRASARALKPLLLRVTAPGALAAWFLVLALPLGAFLAVKVPLGQVADEPTHLLRADGLLHGGLIGHRERITRPDGRTVVAAGMRADPVLLAVVTLPIRPLDTAPHAMTPEMLARARAMNWSAQTVFVDLGSIAGYAPVFYVPAAIALAGSRMAGLSPYDAFLAARLANLLCYAALGAAALWLARRAQALMFWTLAVPMALSLAASVNQDGLLIASAVLAASLVTRADSATGRPVSGSSAYRIAAVLVACIAISKPPYLPLAALLLLPVPSLRPRAGNWPELRRRLVAVALVSIAALGWTWLNVHSASVPRVLPPYEAGPLWPGPRPAIFGGTDMAAQVRVLLAAPLRFLTLPAFVVWHDTGMWPEIIGVLGWLNLALPATLYGLWTAAFAAAAIAAAQDDDWRGCGWIETPLLLGATIVALYGIYISQYLTWTPVGLNWIGGPQGRYMLPLIPMLGLGLPRVQTPHAPALRRALLSLPLAAAATDVLTLPRIIMDFYYRG